MLKGQNDLRPNAPSQTPRKTRKAKSKTSRWGEIIKLRPEINKIETNQPNKQTKNIQRISETKSCFFEKNK
jgi:hypothetical protein